MISTFDIFKIILGVIISAFILFIALRFAGSYMQIGETGREASIIVNFKKTMDNVYTTGIAADFETQDSEVILGYRPPYIETPVSFVDTSPVPVLLVPGEKLLVYRGEYDTGWWKFYFIEALPEMKIVFVMLKEDESMWAVAGNITRMLPSTVNTKTKVRFGFGCNITDPTKFWFGSWERDKFLETLHWLAVQQLGLGPCENTEYFRKGNFTLVTVSDKPEDAAFVVNPLDDDIGYVLIKKGDEQEKYIYKNGLDIVALLLGGEKLYNYTNDKFMKELEVAINVSSKEYDLLMTDATMNQRCGAVGQEFVAILGLIKDLIPKVKGDASESDVREFVQLMKASVTKYKELESRGCA